MKCFIGATPAVTFVAGFITSTFLSCMTWSVNHHILFRDGQENMASNGSSVIFYLRNILNTTNISSEELSLIVQPKPTPGSLLIDDESQHASDNDTIAVKLSQKVRILAWVMTSPATLHTRATHVRNTWGRRCNILLFSSGTVDTEFPTIPVETEEGRAHLTSRTMKTFDYLYAHHLEDADWFLKTDDDTYVIVENLRYFLSNQDPRKPLYFGHHFSIKWANSLPQGYHSGGAGYVISKEALKRFGMRNQSVCDQDGGSEDIKFGSCMTKLGVIAGDSRDALNRTRFHCLPIDGFLLGQVPGWLKVYDRHGVNLGFEGISDYPITFHYINNKTMYLMEHYVYHLRPYGVQTAWQDLNRHQQVEKQDIVVGGPQAGPT